MLERRRAPRIHVELPVVLRHRGRFVPATAVNLSSGGMLIHSDDSNVSTTGQVEILFDLDHEHRDVALRGNVLRVDGTHPTNLGIQFTTVFSEAHRVIQRYLEAKLSS